MRYLLVKEKDKKFTLYSPEVFGIETWGDSYHQTSLEKKRKHWHIVNWYYGGICGDDEETSYKINVVVEDADLDNIIRYVIKHNEKELEHILTDAQKIYNDYIEAQKYFLKNYY